MTTWTYCPSPTGRKTPGESGPFSSIENWSAVDVRQDVDQVAGVEGDRRAVAFDLGLDVALVVADVRGGADGQPDLGVLADVELDDVGRRAGDQAGQPDGREQLVAVDRRLRGEALRQDLLVVGELAVDQPADQVDALEVEQDLVPAGRQDDVDRFVRVGQDARQLVERAGRDDDARLLDRVEDGDAS